MNIRRYADTSPPAEIFDVRAILHGGVPVREVEEDYIREEILEDFDVSLVFDIKNDVKSMANTDERYYAFKPQIESKEALREFILQHAPADTEVDSKVITQLERWWDKYQVSLHELAQQVQDADQVMQGYLKELGYE